MRWAILAQVKSPINFIGFSLPESFQATKTQKLSRLPSSFIFRVLDELLLGRFTVNKVNFFLEVQNNSNNVETKFHGRRISIDEVIKSINVNFLFFR